jgi:hypothetical protein
MMHVCIFCFIYKISIMLQIAHEVLEDQIMAIRTPRSVNKPLDKSHRSYVIL